MQLNSRGKFVMNGRFLVRRVKVHVPSGLRCPPGNWAGPAGSNLESHGGDEMT
jgi:hypothetical protein